MLLWRLLSVTCFHLVDDATRIDHVLVRCTYMHMSRLATANAHSASRRSATRGSAATAPCDCRLAWHGAVKSRLSCCCGSEALKAGFLIILSFFFTQGRLVFVVVQDMCSCNSSDAVVVSVVATIAANNDLWLRYDRSNWFIVLWVVAWLPRLPLLFTS